MRKTYEAPAPINSGTLGGARRAYYNQQGFQQDLPAYMEYNPEEDEENAGVPSPMSNTPSVSPTPYQLGMGNINPALLDAASRVMGNSYGTQGYLPPTNPYPTLTQEDPTAALTASPGNRPWMQNTPPPQRRYGQEVTQNARGMAIGTLLAGALGGTDAALAVGGGLQGGFQQGANAVDAERMRRYELAKEQAGRDYFNQQQSFADNQDAVRAQQAAVAARNELARSKYGANINTYNADTAERGTIMGRGDRNQEAQLRAAEVLNGAQNTGANFNLARSADARAEQTRKLVAAESLARLNANIAPYSGTPYGTSMTNSTNAALVANGMMPIPLPGKGVGIMPMDFNQADQNARTDYTNAQTPEIGPNAEASRAAEAARTQQSAAQLKQQADQFDRTMKFKYDELNKAETSPDATTPLGRARIIAEYDRTIGSVGKSLDAASKAGDQTRIDFYNNEIKQLQRRQQKYIDMENGVAPGAPAPQTAPVDLGGYVPGMAGGALNPVTTGTPFGLTGQPTNNASAPKPLPTKKKSTFIKPIMGKSGVAGTVIP